MIFEDPSKKRWKMTLRLFIILAVVTSLLISLTVYSFVVNSPIPTLARINQQKGQAVRNSLKRAEKKDEAAGKSSHTESGKGTIKKNYASLTKNEIQQINKIEMEKSLPGFSENSYLCTAFVVQDDPLSVEDLKKHIDKLDAVFPEWFSFTGKKSEIDENVNMDFANYLKSNKAMVLPRISNADQNGNWYGTEFSQYIHDENNRHSLCGLIRDTVDKYGVKGINIDFEAIEPNAGNDFLEFLIELRELLHKEGKYLTVDLPMNDEAYDYEAIGNVADEIVVMAYDQHYAGGGSGAIASQDWFTNGIDDILGKIPRKKTIIAMGQYAYDWDTTAKSPAKSLSFDEAMLLAGQVGADVETDKDSINSHFSYVDEKGDNHDVWLLDAVSLWNQVVSLKNRNVYGVSLWRIGTEDPTIWKFFTLNEPEQFDPVKLKTVKTLNIVNFEGKGEILKVTELPNEGERKFTFDGKIIDYADYNKLPTSFDVQNYGRVDSMQIALTFDDGPDPVYTNRILDVLKDNNIKATFFVVGDQLQRNPDVFKREIREGHLVGNHTYTHPNIGKISESSLKIELNSVQRLIEALSGKQTLLFRAPYDTDTNPTNPKDLRPLYQAGKMGYVVTGADIDSADYEKPGVDKIVQNVLNGLKDTGSNIIVLHDAGGNRDQTVAALKILIPKLKSMGYSFVNVNDLLGVPAISLMPNIDLKEQLIVLADKVWSFVYNGGWAFIVILFFISTIISLLRILILGFFVLKSQKSQKRQRKATGKFEPPVTVIVPAYNEEKVIGKTLTWLLKSDYKNFEVLVVDDGSTDNTREEVNRFITPGGNVRLVSKENGGKFSALNLGFAEVKSEFVITIDADTMVLPDTVRNLIAPFAYDDVDAVCGNVQVGNVKNILTGFQAVEYITTQNYDRRAFDELNCISVVPGATGAWRRQRVIDAGGYSDMTLTEDADLTLTMLEKGFKIVYAPDARSITEAPETVRSLFKQRFRWSFGTFQCLWKHKKSFFKGSMGNVALPNMFIFQIVFPVLSPIGDLVFLLSIFRGDVKAILAGYLLFLVMDLAASAIAFTIERAPKKYMLFVLIQRFFYRQFMYAVTFKSIFAAIKGRKHGWDKLKRTNSVNMKEIM